MNGTAATDKSRLRVIGLVVAMSMFMANLDLAIVNTSLPQMAQSFNIGAVDLSAGITAYILSTAIFLPLSAWITERYGTRAVFTASIVVFTLASVACGAAATLSQFVIARIAQGAGAALMTPVGRAVVLKNAEKRDLLNAVALLTWPGLLGPVIAPVLGGFITTYSSWRWNFLLNAPFGLIAVVLALRYVPADAGTDRKPLDLPGLLLSSTALFCLIYSLESFSAGHGDALSSAALCVVGVIGAWLTLRHFKRTPYPLLDLAPFKSLAFSLTDRTAGFVFRCTIAATPFLLPLLLQLAYGLNPLQAGGFIMSYFLGNLVMKPVTSPILRRFGFRNVLIANGLISGAAIMACGFVSPLSAPWLANAVFLLTGLARSMQFTGMNTLGFADLPASLRTAASTLHSMMLQLSMALGVAGVALVLQKSAHWRGAANLALVDFRIAFIVVGVVGMLSALMFARLAPDAGADVSGHTRR